MHNLGSRLLFAGILPALFVAGTAAALPVGPDILVSDGTIVATAADYEMNGNMWVASTHWEDTTLHVYQSTDHGLSWQQRLFASGFGPIFGQLGLVVGEGDSAFVYTFFLDPANNGDLWLMRLAPRTDSVWTIPVMTGPDTIRDYAVCRDYTGDDYWLYAAVTAPDANPQRELRLLRSSDYGRDWSVTESLSLGGLLDPHLSAGAGAYIYLAARSGDTLWRLVAEPRPDFLTRQIRWDKLSDSIRDPVIAAAFTLPESTAAVWCVWSESDSGNWNVKYSYTMDGGMGWSSPEFLAASTEADEQYPDLRNYADSGNHYINVSYISDENGFRSVFRRYARSSTPDQWSDTLRINQVSAGTGPEVRPKLCYTPGGPFSGGGCVFVGQGLNGCWWNAPYPDYVAEVKGGAVRPVLIQPSIGRGPFFIRAESPTVVSIRDRAGRLVRSLEAGRSGTASWDGRDGTGEPVASGIYFIRLGTGDRTAAEKILLQR